MIKRITRTAASGLACLAVALAGGAVAVPAYAQYAEKISNDPRRCAGGGPAVRINVSGIESATGNMRVQIYRAVRGDWLEKDRWIYRIEAPARAGSMTFCMPVPQAGQYAVAIRHDANDNDETDIFADGGGMSNNPSVNIFNLGRPSHTRTAFQVGNEVKTIDIRMRYF
jgi:uncharacterized protein (DUF2141 family)